METIRKKICVDNFLSHRPGVMPYIKKDSYDNSITYIEGTEDNSNYGNFACDFVLIDSSLVYDSDTGLSYRENTELSRLRYLDILRMYNRYYEIVNNGVILKKGVYSGETTEYIDCVDPTNNIVSNNVFYRWTTIGTEDKSIYDCIPVNSKFFNKDSLGGYFFGGPEEELANILAERRFNLVITEEESELLDELELMIDSESGIIFTEDYIFVVDDYDELKQIEDTWSKWWEDNFSQCSYSSNYDIWQKAILDPFYEAPVVQTEYEERRKCYLNFLYDVEKYILGRIRVPLKYEGDEIEGTKTPSYIYYLTYNFYKNWFEDNSPYILTNNELKKKWDSYGGDEFYHFLQSIIPHFLNSLILPEYGNITAITYAPPVIEIPLSIVNETIPEETYKACELSVDINNNIADGTYPYSAPTHGVGSALTPTFRLFESGEVIVESKLNYLFNERTYFLNDDVYGILEEFTNGGQLFRCKHKTGTSTQPLVLRCCVCTLYEPGKRIGNNGEWVVAKTVTLPEEVISTVRLEEMPKAGNSTYQIVGIKKVHTTTNNVNIEHRSGTTVLEDGTVWVSSAFTYYDKRITNTYSWWYCDKVTEEMECGDGEDIDFSTTEKYRNILLLSCVPSACETETGTYYYMVKYDNGYTNVSGNMHIDTGSTTKRMSIPYTVDKKMNITSFDGEFSSTTIYDKLLRKEIIDDGSGHTSMVLEYVIGATSGTDIRSTGIHYIEKKDYKGNVIEPIVIDGHYDAEILYEKATGGETMVYSDDLSLYRNTNVAEIIGMEIGTQWTSASCINAYLFTEESSDNLIEYPKVNVDISYNRGNASTWEKRFKLSECNTMEDLINYGNNYFNIQ